MTFEEEMKLALLRAAEKREPKNQPYEKHKNDLWLDLKQEIYNKIMHISRADSGYVQPMHYVVEVGNYAHAEIFSDCVKFVRGRYDVVFRPPHEELMLLVSECERAFTLRSLGELAETLHEERKKRQKKSTDIV